jgi:hypothetical protein
LEDKMPVDPGMMEEEVERRYVDYDKNLVGMEKRARLAEIVLGLFITIVLNLACISYCKMYNKKGHEEKMEAEVNE